MQAGGSSREKGQRTDPPGLWGPDMNRGRADPARIGDLPWTAQAEPEDWGYGCEQQRQGLTPRVPETRHEQQ